MKLNLRELNSMGDTLQFEYIFGTWQIFKKRNAADLNIFFSACGIWAENN